MKNLKFKLCKNYSDIITFQPYCILNFLLSKDNINVKIFFKKIEIKGLSRRNQLSF